MFLQFGIRVKVSVDISIDMSYTASQKYKLCNIFLVKFTAYSKYCLQSPAENHKCYGQAPN